MAHYLAERIAAAEAATPPEKERLEREVFDVILQLWKHRGSWPGRGRPFRETGELADRLRTFMDVSVPRYFVLGAERSDPRAAVWMDRAHGIDLAARDLIRWCIDHALAEITGADEEWADDKTGQKLDDDEDIRLARTLFQEIRISFGSHAPDDKLAETRRMKDDLDVFLAMAAGLREKLVSMIAEAGPDTPPLS